MRPDDLAENLAQPDFRARFRPKRLSLNAAGTSLDLWQVGYQLPTHDNYAHLKSPLM